MLGLAAIALGIVISATPVAAQGHHDAAQSAPPQSTPLKGSSKATPAKKPEQNAGPNPAAQQDGLRPPIGPRTTQGLAEDAISRGNR